VDIDLPSFLRNKNTQDTVAQINDILHDSLEEGDSGDFEVNGVVVHVKELKNRIRENIYVKKTDLSKIGLITL
jgi:DNA repair exonuclease SbcCD ATPase subunit